MNNIERFTLELAKRLAGSPMAWGVRDDMSRETPNDVRQVETLHQAVKESIHILIHTDLECRIERARKELEFLEGLR
jgi:hypothetical protein